MKRIVLKPSRHRPLAMLAIALPLAVISASIAIAGNAWGWFGIALFGTSAVVSGIALLPGAGSLELSAHGFTIRSLFRSSHVRWDDVERFVPILIDPGLGVVGIQVTLDYEKGAAVRTLLRGAGLEDQGFLPDTYGMEVDELVNLMNEWCLRYRSRRPDADTIPVGHSVSTGESIREVFSRSAGSRRPRFRGFKIRRRQATDG